jgi:DNA-binding transcriptional LysR family regulator
MLDLSGMAIFVSVVESESFTGAARELGLSKSAVSKQIARLEDRLGARLLNRTTRRLSLTEAGTAFYEGCRRVVDEAEVAEQRVSRLSAAPRGLLRVNAPMSFGVRHVGPCLSDFLSACPELTLDLALNDRLVDLVEEGYDVAVRIGVLADSSLVARRLAPSHLVLCAAPGYLVARGRPAAPEDLARHDCASYSYRTAGPEWRFLGPDGLRRVKVSGRVTVNNGDVLLAAALRGLGIVMLPSFIAGDALRAGHLERVLPEWRVAEEANVYAVYPASRNLSPKVRVFVDFLAERFGEAPYWDEGIGP